MKNKKLMLFIILFGSAFLIIRFCFWYFDGNIHAEMISGQDNSKIILEMNNLDKTEN